MELAPERGERDFMTSGGKGQVEGEDSSAPSGLEKEIAKATRNPGLAPWAKLFRAFGA